MRRVNHQPAPAARFAGNLQRLTPWVLHYVHEDAWAGLWNGFRVLGSDVL
jgi:hypothetical protein